MKNIIGVRFKKLGKIYFFNPKNLKVKKGDKVIVETSQGEEYGEVMMSVEKKKKMLLKYVLKKLRNIN